MGEKGAPTQVEDLAFRFSVALIKFLKTLPRMAIELELLRQLIRAGTSIGANIEEAEGARTKREFINSMNIAKREARETVYWLRVFDAVYQQGESPVNGLLSQAETLVRMLSAIVKTSEPRRF